MKILVFEPNYLGDVLMTVPALRLLRSGFKDARIAAVVNGGLADTLHGFADEIIPRPAKMLFNDRLELFKKARAFRPDAAVLFRTTLNNAVVARFSGARARAGVAGECAGPFLTKTFRRGSPKPPFYREYIELARLAGATGEVEPRLKINITEEAKSSADRILKENGIDAGKGKIIAVSPGSTRPAKMWNARKFAELIDRFNPSLKIIITGTAAERNLAEEITSGCTLNKPVLLAGLTSIMQLAAILSKCNLYIGPDSGALYLAVAAGVPVVGLFGSTDPALYGPFNKGDIIIFKKTDCEPCYREKCGRSDFCMDRITVDEVYHSAERALEKNG